MKTRVQGSGNSSARRVSKSSAAESNDEEEPAVNVPLAEGETIIEPFSERTYILEDLLAGITKQNVHAEIDTGGPVGKEIFKCRSPMFQTTVGFMCRPPERTECALVNEK